MPRNTTEIDLEAEHERLQNKRERLADEAAEMDSNNPLRQIKVQEGMATDRYVDGLYWAIHQAADDEDVPEWDDDVDTITLSGLNGEEYGALEGELDEVGEDRNPKKVERVYHVRDGTADAPYVGGDMSELEETHAVGTLPKEFLLWADWRIDRLSSVGGDKGNGFAELLVEKQASQQQPTSETTPSRR